MPPSSNRRPPSPTPSATPTPPAALRPGPPAAGVKTPRGAGARAEDAHRLLLVLELRLLVLHRDDEPGRKVRDADRRVGRVHALPARPGRAIDVDLQIVGVDVDLDLLRLGHHGDSRGRGVDA